MPRLLLLATLAVFASACSSDNGDIASVGDVKRVLSGAHLRAQKVKLVIKIERNPMAPLPPVNYCGAEVVKQPSAASLDVVAERAIVMVFESDRAADEWTPLPECGAKPFRVRNVIAVPTDGGLSQRVRHALMRLR